MKSEKLLAAFTPSIMSHETLEAIFVRREALAARLMDNLRISATTPSKRHSLLVGPRGIGKTYLVSLLYHRVKEDEELQDRFRIAWLREENWEVTSFLDLMESILAALADEYEDKALCTAIAELRTFSIENAEAHAERLLLDFLSDQVLLLIVENLDDLFNSIEEMGQKQLRAFLQNHANTVLVATTPSLFYGVSDQDAPFYNFFNVTHLDELTLDDAVQLLEKIANLRADSDLAAFIRTDTGHHRLEAVQHLAGGHPRIWIFFAGIVTEEALDALVPIFLQMLDDLTPYYQSRMKELPPQQRKIVSYLCTTRGAVPVKNIADACRLSQPQTAAQLHDLRKKAFVRSEAIGRESWYELNEPLMRLVFEIKESRGRPIRLIVDFLRRWYNRSERRAKYEAAPTEARTTRLYVEAALDLRSFSDVEPHSRETVMKWSVPSELMDAGEFEKALGIIEDGIEEAGRLTTAKQWTSHGQCLLRLQRYTEALESLDRAIELNPTYAYSHSDRGNVLNCLRRFTEALESLELAIKIDPTKANSHARRGISLANLDRLSEAWDSLDRSIELDPTNFLSHSWLGAILFQVGFFAGALESFDRAIKLNPRHAYSFSLRSETLAHMGDFIKALESADQAIELDPSDAFAYYQRGCTLERVGRLIEALASFDHVLELDPSWTFIYVKRGSVLNALQRYTEALMSLDRAIELYAGNTLAYYNRAQSYLALRRWWDFLDDLRQVLKAAEPNHDEQWGYTRSYCQLLLEVYLPQEWSDLIAMIVGTYAEYDALKWLGQGLTGILPDLFETERTFEVTDTWNAAWQAGGMVYADLEIPLRLLDAAVQWRRKPDRRILLRLLVEERRVLEKILPAQG